MPQDMTGFPFADAPYKQLITATHAIGATQPWQIWEKPRGISFVHCILISGGGGGGGGFTRVAAANGGGGGGGGTGARNTFLVPAFLLPDRLYLQIGKGGLGSTGTGVAGSSGQSTLISPYPSSGAGLHICNSSGGGGGAAGAATGNAAGGVTGTASTNQSFLSGLITLVNYSAIAGATGGLFDVAGTSITMGSANCGCSGGAGGAGVTATDRAGGGQNSPSTAWFPNVAGAAAGSNRGQDGFWNWLLFGGPGGCGGGSSNAGVGGAGGHGGGYGNGGGGGGSGTTGGAGGNGGDGIAILTAW